MSILNQRFMTGCWSEHSERVDHCIIAREQPRARQRKERSWEDLHADSDDECLACCSSQSAFHSIPKNLLVGRTLRRMSPNSSPSARTCKAYDAALTRVTERQVKAVEVGVPTTQVVRLPRANHYVCLSNEPDVLRHIRSFMSRLR